MDWKVSISDNPETGKVAFRFWKPLNFGKVKVMCPLLKEGKFVWNFVECDEGDVMPVTFEISQTIVKMGFLDVLVEELQRTGARKSSDGGEKVIEAMADHLSDLKSLLFGSDKVAIERRDGSANL